jgi:hypothetical protein
MDSGLRFGRQLPTEAQPGMTPAGILGAFAWFRSSAQNQSTVRTATGDRLCCVVSNGE